MGKLAEARFCVLPRCYAAGCPTQGQRSGQELNARERHMWPQRDEHTHMRTSIRARKLYVDRRSWTVWRRPNEQSQVRALSDSRELQYLHEIKLFYLSLVRPLFPDTIDNEEL